MSISRKIDQLKNLIGIKKVIILEGNVDDLYEYKNKYSNIHEILEGLFLSKNYKNIYFYDQNQGLYGEKASQLNDSNTSNSEFGDIFDTTESNNKSKPINFFQLLNKNLNLTDKEIKGFIADYSDFIFSDQSLSKEDQLILTEFHKTLKENVFNISTVSSLNSTVIFITKKINQLPPSFYLDNSDITILTIPKPSRNERQKLINTLSPTLTKILDFEKQKENMIDIMDGWTLKEISHYTKFVSNIENTTEFSKTFNQYLYGENVSPWEELDYEKMKNVEEFLNKKVIGQPESISKVSKVLYKAYTGLSGVAYSATKNKPKGTLFFVGPTGVGKTELAKAITTFLFGDESNLIRFDMSEYGQDNSDQKLIGAPPGYVGFEGGGQLTNAVKEKPFSVILFDEIEKASPKIFDKFLQILEDGRLTDNTGQTINFSETFIIFTSNIGASVVSPSDDKDQVYKQFLKEVQNHFTNELNRPELLGRFGNNIIPFNFISDIKLQARIVASKLKPIQLAIYNKYQVLLELDLNNSQILKTILKDVDIKRGGRDVINSLETNLTGPLSEFIFKNLPNMKSGIKIITSDKNGQLVFNLT